MTDPAHTSLALAAAMQASEATAELVRFAREGPNWPVPFGHVELIEQLADATKLALELLSAEAPFAMDAEREKLLGALSDYLQGWAG